MRPQQLSNVSLASPLAVCRLSPVLWLPILVLIGLALGAGKQDALLAEAREVLTAP
jgi:hypothetical protein